MTSDAQWERIRAYARRLAAEAPPLTDEQAERLSALFQPVVARLAVEHAPPARTKRPAA